MGVGVIKSSLPQAARGHCPPPPNQNLRTLVLLLYIVTTWKHASADRHAV